jgi:hypothetical protein
MKENYIFISYLFQPFTVQWGLVMNSYTHYWAVVSKCSLSKMDPQCHMSYTVPESTVQ